MMQKLNQDLSYVPVPPGPPAATPRSPRGKERYQTGETNEEHQLLPRSLFPVDSTAVAEGDMSSAASRTREFRQIRKCKSATFTVDGYSYTIGQLFFIYILHVFFSFVCFFFCMTSLHFYNSNG